MRSLIAGVDDAGRSCIAEEIVIKDADVHRDGPSTRTDIFQLRETPPPARLHRSRRFAQRWGALPRP